MIGNAVALLQVYMHNQPVKHDSVQCFFKPKLSQQKHREFSKANHKADIVRSGKEQLNIIVA